MAKEHDARKARLARLRRLHPDHLMDDRTLLGPGRRQPDPSVLARLGRAAHGEGREDLTVIPVGATEAVAGEHDSERDLGLAGALVERGPAGPGAITVLIVSDSKDAFGPTDGPGPMQPASSTRPLRHRAGPRATSDLAGSVGLELTTGGCWAVTTSSGTVYRFDLDAQFVTRCRAVEVPQAGHVAVKLRRDGTALPLLRLHCRLGLPLKMLIRVRQDSVVTLRVGTEVRSIRRLGPARAA